MHDFLFIFLLCIYYVWRKLLLYPFFPIAFFNSRLSRVKANETNANELRFWNRLLRSYTFEKETSYAIFWSPRTLTFLLCLYFEGGLWMDFYEKDLSSFSFFMLFSFSMLWCTVTIIVIFILFDRFSQQKIQFGLCHSACKKYILLLLHYIRLFIVFLFLV